jgi:hypothetical protein
MTTTHNRARAERLLREHQGDDLRTTSTSVSCTCGVTIPVHPAAIARHIVGQLLLADLLRPDPTGPLPLIALQDMGPGEVVFDRGGQPWMCCGFVDDTSEALWVSYAEGVPDELCTSDLHAERSPLATDRAKAGCGS